MQAAIPAEEEPVAVYDAAGSVVGVAPRGVVYRDGLWHGATGVLVRSTDGDRVYLHRRSPDKLIFPGMYDCWAGGVIGPGGAPAAGGRRGLAGGAGRASRRRRARHARCPRSSASRPSP